MATNVLSVGRDPYREVHMKTNIAAEALSNEDMSALARIEAAGHFKVGSLPIDPEIARLASGHMRGLAPKLVCSLVDHDLAAWTRDGLRITPEGRDRLVTAINARKAKK